MALTDKAIKALQPTGKKYKATDGGGLYLLVQPNGGKFWKLAYRYAEKQKELSLGKYPAVTLRDARAKRIEAKQQLQDGIDPSATKRAQKLSILKSSQDSFEAIALEWFQVKMSDKSKSHQDRTLRALQKDLFPQIGREPISSITPPILLAALRRIELRGAVETAHRAKQTAGQIFRYAVATGRAERDPTPDLKGALKTPVETHLAAITAPKEVGRLLLAIDGFQGTATVRAALALSPLLFCRPGELRHMEWQEINWEENRWEIPGEKMKMGQPHIVPLSEQALTILQEHQRITGHGKYVFPGARGMGRPLSENGVRTALRTMGYDNDTMTPHGFRAMARTLLDEVLGFRVEWIEQQLAHAVKDTLGRAYNRTTHLEHRIKMMQAWADYLDRLKIEASNANVITGTFGARS